LQLANARLTAGDTNRALSEFRAAAGLGPQDPKPWQLLALHHWRTGEAVAAVGAAREALAINPYEPAAHALLGMNLMALNDPTDARWHLEYACRAKPDLIIAQAHLGRLLLAAGQASDAIGPLAAAVNATPNDLDLRRQHALALQQAGQGAAAAAAWRAAMSLAPDQPDLLNNLAWLLATDPDSTIRDGPEAVRLAERACQLTDRQQPALLGTLGAAYAAAGQFDRAITAAEAAIQLAQRRDEPELLERNTELLVLYRDGKPFIQTRPAR
jgi:Flp pilus assembly protein TadD